MVSLGRIYSVIIDELDANGNVEPLIKALAEGTLDPATQKLLSERFAENTNNKTYFKLCYNGSGRPPKVDDLAICLEIGRAYADEYARCQSSKIAIHIVGVKYGKSRSKILECSKVYNEHVACLREE